MLDFECVLNTGMNHKDLLMTLQIETYYRLPSLYCEVYQEPEGRGKLFWIYSLQYDNRFIQLIQYFGDTYNIPKGRGIEEIFTNPHFVKEYQKANPAQCVIIPAEKMAIFHKINNEGLPKDVHYPSGCDGHEYLLKTYGKTNEEYRSWIEIPKEWNLFAELTETLIEVAGWDKSYDCQFRGNAIKDKNDNAV